jgi:hypothetical protein
MASRRTRTGRRRKNRCRAVLALFVAASFIDPPSALAKDVRMFAVGNRIRISDFASYESFRDKMFAMVDSTYPARASLVQPGVDDVASHIQPSDPFAPADALVNFPESVALPAAFIGARGNAARSASNSAQAFIALNTAYAPQIASYKLKFGLFDQADFTRLIVLAVTDTVYRAFFETFRDMAMTYGIYMTVGADVPPARKVYEADDPVTYGQFIDPAESGVRPYAYVATSPDPVNATFVFQPDGEVFVQAADGTPAASPSGTGGEIRGSATKVYLTPIELTLLKLADGPVDRLNVLDTPVGRMGIVISKDAWMIDVNDRLAARHAHVMVQSEAFSSWAFQTHPWDPDIFKQGGFNNLQQYQTRVLNVDPSMVGNLLEITFDGQSSILGRRTKTDPGSLDGTNAWIGQNPDTGFLAVAPWIVPDPGMTNPGLSLADRRAALAVEGVKLLPGSGVPCPTPLAVGPCENGYREAVVWADVEIPDGLDVLTAPDPTPAAPTAYGSSVQVNSDDSGSPSSQLYPQMAAEGDGVFLVWQDTRHGHDNVYAAFSADAGVTWSAEVRVSDNPPGAVVEMLPEIAVHRDPATGLVTVFVVWQELVSGTGLEDGRIMLARFDETLSRVDSADMRVDDVDGAGKWHPVVVATGKRGNPLVIWVDERNPGPRLSILEHLYAAKGRGHRARDSRPALRFSKARRVVRQKEVDLMAAQLANEWAPAVTYADRRIVLGWLDFRQYNWDVYSSFSRTGLRYARPPIRVDDSLEFERLNSHPSLAYEEDSGRLIMVWADQRAREVDTNIFIAVSTDGGATWSAPTRLDTADLALDPDTATPSNQWQPEIAAAAGRVCVAWQDGRLGNNDIFAVVSTDGGATFSSDERVDDSQGGPSEQFSPTTAVAAGRCYVAWSDDRSGDADIRFASRVF